MQIKYNGYVVKGDQFDASVYNSTTFLVKFTGLGSSVSLNENALSFSFEPGTIVDQYGNILTTVTFEATVTETPGVTEAVAKAAEPVTTGTEIVSYILLALLGLFFIKSGYPALITLEIVQLIYMHIFLFTSPLPYL